MPPGGIDHDSRVRHAAFAFLAEQCRQRGETLPWKILAEGFTFEGARVPLVSQQGIFKPQVLDELPLSIRTTAAEEGAEPYADKLGADGNLSYCYRGQDPNHRDNRGLRRAFVLQRPLIYFFGVESGWYRALWPAFIVSDNLRELRFEVAIDDEMFASPSDTGESEIRRRYVTRFQRARLHQDLFRSRVLRAYSSSCAICHLKHRELLDAAHIVEDNQPTGEPVIPNGIALCKIHHAAFDRNILGIRPDRVVEIKSKVLLEIDGPMLLHGLQGFHGKDLSVPRDPAKQPDKERLGLRYEAFRRTG